MKVKINKPIVINGGENAMEQTIVDIPDDQLLKLGKKYFELASNPTNQCIIADNIVTGRQVIDAKDPNKDFFDVLRDKYSVFDFISMLRDVKEVKTYGNIPINEADITEFIHNIYVLAQRYRSDVK